VRFPQELQEQVKLRKQEQMLIAAQNLGSEKKKKQNGKHV
jgi:hypothetical protein